MTVIGGPMGFFGPMIGSVIYTFLMAFITGFTEYWPMTIGLIIMFVVLFMPGGVQGLAETRLKSFRSKDPAAEMKESADMESA